MSSPSPTLLAWPDRWDGVDFHAVADCWNQSAHEHHAFFPWTGPLLETRLTPASGWDPRGLFVALDADRRVLGAASVAIITEDSGYDPAAALELLMVRPDARGHGIGRALVDAALDYARARGAPFVDAMGAWPYGPHFHTLADGSERSGVFRRDMALGACLRSAGFVDDRESRVLRMSPSDAPMGPLPWADETIRDTPRVGERTWLDHTFRAWRLRDHVWMDESGYGASRAIYARMDGLSDFTGREHYALFGVYTPPWRRRGGAARRNLSALMGRLASRGVSTVELHCYADNEPALGLYGRLGFVPVAETRKMICTL